MALGATRALESRDVHVRPNVSMNCAAVTVEARRAAYPHEGLLVAGLAASREVLMCRMQWARGPGAITGQQRSIQRPASVRRPDDKQRHQQAASDDQDEERP